MSADLSSVFQIGPRITAQVLGQPFTQYRPTSALQPLAAPLATLPVWVTADPKLMGASAFKREKPDERFAGLDPALTKVGDYLVGAVVPGDPVKTFFIASQDLPAPIRLVECYHTLSFAHQTEDGAYAGQTSAGTPYLTGWPASMVQGTKGEVSVGKLPGDVRSPWFSVLMPFFSGALIHEFDQATDENGNRYVVSSPELTAQGWRLTLSYSGT